LAAWFSLQPMICHTGAAIAGFWDRRSLETLRDVLAKTITSPGRAVL
jgi:hypothetical protein